MKRNMLTIFAVLVLASACMAEELWTKTVGDVKVGDVKGGVWELPVLLWGGDFPWFLANGGAETKPGSILGQLGLKIKIVRGDDPIGQSRRYVAGDSPFLRGTDAMLYQASQLIADNQKTKGYLLFQETWSAGDWFVVRKGITTMSDLKGQKVVMQRGGPHWGCFDDALFLAQMSWSDVQIVWADDLTGTPKSPAEMFRNDPSIKACFVVTPDMNGLTGGPDNIPDSSVEGLVEGSRVLFGTPSMNYSIWDGYVVRQEWYDARPADVHKLVFAFHKAVEELLDLAAGYEKGDKDKTKKYLQILQMAQDFYGKKDIPTLEKDAHGLVMDAKFAGHPGNIAFFQETGSGHGFQDVQNKRLDLVVRLGYASLKQGIAPSPINWSDKIFDGLATKGATKKSNIKSEELYEKLEQMEAAGTVGQRKMLAFSVYFDINQTTFDPVQYAADFERVLNIVAVGGNFTIAVRGNVDSHATIVHFINAGLANGFLRRDGDKQSGFRYFLRSSGKQITFDNVAEVLDIMNNPQFTATGEWDPKGCEADGLRTSKQRAQEVKDAIIKYAASKNFKLNPDQLVVTGVGIREPVHVKPNGPDQSKKNRRVEIAILNFQAEDASLGYEY